MSSVVHPVGRKPARVYWVRRLVVVLVLVAVIGALAFGVTRLAAALGGDSSAAPAPAPTTTTPAASTADGPAACGAADLQLSLTASATSYPAGANPELTLSIVNGGTHSCTFDASAANREIVITSGADRIWSSKDCQAETAEDLLLLGAGASAPATVTWDRTRSAEGCPGGLPEPRPGTYKATATVAGVTLPEVPFTLG